MEPEQITQLKELVGSATSVVVMLKSEPSTDQAAAALGLAGALVDAGKEVVVACPLWLEADVSPLQLSGWLRDQLGNRDLVVSFPYSEAAVDKVSYHIDDEAGKFFLVVKPQKGQPPLSSSGVEYSYSGAEADLILLVGVHTWESLEHLYTGYEQFFANTTSVAIHTFEPQIGSMKYNLSEMSSFSEGVTRLLTELELNVGTDAATDLLTGIELATNHLSSLSVTPDTLERMAWLMRSGGRRLRRQAAPVVSSAPVITPSVVEVGEMEDGEETSAGSLADALKSRSSTDGVVSSKKLPKAGSLDYQPTGFGPGGAG
jgi:hypothetical protein